MNEWWRDTLEWVGFCLLVELIVACFTGAVAVSSPHFGARSMVVGALITAGFLLICTLISIIADELEEARKDVA